MIFCNSFCVKRASKLLYNRNAWDSVAGPMVARYTQEKFIKNQILFVKITNPALRQDLSMMRQQLTRRLNEVVGSSVISDVRVF